MHPGIRSWVVLAALGLLHATATAGSVIHVPPADGIDGASVELVAEAGADTPTMVAHYRRAGGAAFTTVELVRRDATHWVAVIPAAAVASPGLEYYLEAGTEAVFASAQLPHTVAINVSQLNERRTRDLRRTGGRRSRVHLGGDWVDYGTRTVQGQRLIDRYYRLDADFSYRLLTYPLEEVRVGYTRLLGDTEAKDCATLAPCTGEAGYKVGGWFELGLAAVESIRLDARLLVMATQSGFKVGGRLEGRLGALESSHVALGIESMADVGISGYFRLGWGTVPGLPMAATVEISDLPDSDRPTGVRLYYDLSRAVAPGVRLGVRVGYAARNQSVAGFTGGGNAIVDF